MSTTLPGRLQELQWAVDHWDLTDGPIAEASGKQAQYIMTLIGQAEGQVNQSTLNDIVMAAGLPAVDAVGVSTMKSHVSDLHWKMASNLIGDLKKALGPGAGMTGSASSAQLGYILKLAPKKDQKSAKALFVGLGLTDVPKSATDIEGLTKAQASKIIDSLTKMPPASAVAPSEPLINKPMMGAIEDMIMKKGFSTSKVKTLAKKYKVGLYGGNISISGDMTQANAEALFTELTSLPSPGSAEDPASGLARNAVFGLYVQKGGTDNDKVVKVLKTHGMSGPYATALDLPISLTDATAKELIKQLKKLKMRSASRQQVAQVLALLSQLGPAAWKKSPLSKKWPSKELRSSNMLKRTSVEMKTFMAALKKELVHAH